MLQENLKCYHELIELKMASIDLKKLKNKEPAQKITRKIKKIIFQNAF